MDGVKDSEIAEIGKHGNCGNSVFDKSSSTTRMRDRPLWPQLVAEVQFKKIKVVKLHPAIHGVAEKGCCGKGVVGNVLRNDEIPKNLN